MHKHRLERVLVVNDNFELRGLITVKDILKSSEHPNACKDNQGRLRVGAAVGVGGGTEERVEALIEAGVDVIVVDTAHGHSEGVLDRVAGSKRSIRTCRSSAAISRLPPPPRRWSDRGADAVKVGIGPGSICTTRIVAGVGVPQITAIANVARALARHRRSVIADGGIRYSGDIAKALAAGAHCVMIGQPVRRHRRSARRNRAVPGPLLQVVPRHGFARRDAEGSADRYFQEATSERRQARAGRRRGPRAYKGGVVPLIQQLVGGLRASMGYLGCATIDEMRAKAEFVEITSAGMRESHVHDVQITKEAPNYRIE